MKAGALEKQENQMVVKHRTGKPKSGISVFSGSLGASTLLFAFSFLFLFFFFFAVVVWVGGGGDCFTFVTQAGLELEALLKPLLLGHRLVTTPALKKNVPSPIGEEGWIEGPTYPRLALGSLSSSGWP